MEYTLKGLPIVATTHLYNEVNNVEQFKLVWNEFGVWRKHIQATLHEEEQLFTTEVNGKKVWVIADGQAITMMYPEDY